MRTMRTCAAGNCRASSWREQSWHEQSWREQGGYTVTASCRMHVMRQVERLCGHAWCHAQALDCLHARIAWWVAGGSACGAGPVMGTWAPACSQGVSQHAFDCPLACRPSTYTTCNDASKPNNSARVSNSQDMGYHAWGQTPCPSSHVCD
jgi:hypothetical protein